MAEFGLKWLWGLRSVWMVLLNFLLALVFVSAERGMRLQASRPNETEGPESSYLLKAINFLWQPDKSGYQHVWPVYSNFSHYYKALSSTSAKPFPIGQSAKQYNYIHRLVNLYEKDPKLF